MSWGVVSVKVSVQVITELINITMACDYGTFKGKQVAS